MVLADFLFAGLIIAALIAAAMHPARPPRWASGRYGQIAAETQEERFALTTFIWLLLIILTAAVLARCLWTGP